jgi:hypothetical protein
MPNGKGQVEAVDHRAEARRRLGLALGARTGIDVEVAQVHASVAIAGQLERLNDNPYVEDRYVPAGTPIQVGGECPEGYVRIPTVGAEPAWRRIQALEAKLRDLADVDALAEQDQPAPSLGRDVCERLEEIAAWSAGEVPADFDFGETAAFLRDLAKNLGDGGQGEGGALRAVRGEVERLLQISDASLRDAEELERGSSLCHRWSGSSVALGEVLYVLDATDPLATDCEHEWVDPSNEVVDADGHKLCTRCGAIQKTQPVPSHLSEEGRQRLQVAEAIIRDCDSPDGFCGEMPDDLRERVEAFNAGATTQPIPPDAALDGLDREEIKSLYAHAAFCASDARGETNPPNPGRQVRWARTASKLKAALDGASLSASSDTGGAGSEAEKWKITSDAHCSVLMRAEDVLLSRFDGLDVGDKAEEVQRLLTEFDAWLSFRGEFGEVLTAFRSAFGTDTSAAAMEANSPQQSVPDTGEGTHTERVIDILTQHGAKWDAELTEIAGQIVGLLFAQPDPDGEVPGREGEADRVGIAQTFQRWAREKRAAAKHFVGPEKEQTIWFAKGLDCAADYLLTATLPDPPGEVLGREGGDRG